MNSNEANPDKTKKKLSTIGSILAVSLSAFSAATVTGQETEITAKPVLEEVIVTAQKREQNLQEVPLAVSVFSAEMLQNRQISFVRGSKPDLSIGDYAGCFQLK